MAGSNNSMPTTSVSSSGSNFMANATTSSTFSGSPTGSYNATWQYYTYTVPIAPSTGNVTVIYNASWSLANVYPSTYAINTFNHFLTLQDVSGFSSVQVEFVEPNQFVGSLEPVSLSYNPSGVQFASGDLNHVTYTTFGSSTPFSYTTTQDYIQLPFGSVASFSTTNAWGQQIASVSNFTVTQSNSVQMNASVTDVNFNPLNGSITYLYVKGSGFNVSVQPQLSFYLANNSRYEYYATIPSGSASPVYTGTIITDSPFLTVPIYGNAPEEGLTVYQNAYNGSQTALGMNNSFGSSPFVEMTINGKAWQQGQTYDTYAGSVISIHLLTILGQRLNFYMPVSSSLTLASVNGYLNFTMPAFTLSYQLYITTPSYVFGIINDEAVPASSPLATQLNNVSLISNASVDYHYKTMVGKESEIYLAATGTTPYYHFYTHDNITNAIDFNLTGNTFYVLNGQNVTLYQVWLKEQQTNSNITNATTHIKLSIVSAPTQIFPDAPLVYKYQAEWQNNTPLTPAQVSSMLITANLINATTSNPSTAIVHVARSGSFIWFNFTSPASGNFDLYAVVSMSPYQATVDQSIYVQPVIKTSVGMSETLVVPNPMYVNTTYEAILYIYYGNGTLMNESDTHAVLDHTANATLFVGTLDLGTIQPVYVSAGEAEIPLNISAIASYRLFVSTSSFSLDGFSVSASAVAHFPVSSRPVSPLQAVYNAFANFFTLSNFAALGHDVLNSLEIWIPVSIILGVLYWAYRKVRNYVAKDKADKATIDLATLGGINNVFSGGVVEGVTGLVKLYSQLTENQQLAFTGAARGLLKAYPIVKIVLKGKISTITMLEARDHILNSQGSTKLSRYYQSLRAAFMTRERAKD